MSLFVLRSWFQALALSLLCVSSAAGQIPEEAADQSQQVIRPASIGRVVRHFDFEERGFNSLDIPLYWIRAQHDPEVRERPGFPISNLGRLDYTSQASSGFGSVRLDTAGGSTSLRLDPGVVPVFPSVQYAVGAMVRVDGLEHAHPRLIARLLDEAGQPIAGTETSQVIWPTSGGWDPGYVPVLLKLPPAPSAAVSVQIDLELAQPRQRGGGADAYKLWQEDYAGSVWFDDVVVVQLPTASLASVRESNTFVAGERPELLAAVRDLSGDHVVIDLFVRDIDGVVVAHRSEQFEMGHREYRWQPELPALGWYEAELVVRVGKTPMLRLSERFVWLPDVARVANAVGSTSDGAVPDRVSLAMLADRRRLGLVFPDSPGEGMPAVAGEILERSGSRSLMATVEIPAEPAGLANPANQAWSGLARQITAMRTRLGVETTIVLEAGDESGDQGHTSGGDRAFMALEDAQLWDDFLVGLIDRLAVGVDRWHIGPLGNDALAASPGTVARLDAISTRLARLAPEPTVGIPWWGRFDPAGATLPAVDSDNGRRWAVTVGAPPDADAGWVGEVSDRLQGMIGSNKTAEGVIVLGPLAPTLHSRRGSVARLAEQMLAFWDALPAIPKTSGAEVPAAPMRLGLAGAFEWEPSTGRVEMDARLAAWRGIGDRLVGLRRIYGFDNADGIEASVYEPAVDRVDGSGGLLVLRPSATRSVDHFELYLGELPVRVYDVFGNMTVINATEVPEPHTPTPRLVHRIPLGDMPVFVEGIDTDLLMFIASLRLEPALLPAIDVDHEAALVMYNPWPGVTSVRARIVSPGGFGGLPVSERSWEISPRLTDLLLEGGQERRAPVNIRFRRSEPAGRKSLGLELDIRGENSARRVRVDVPFRIGLDYLDVTASARRTGDGVLVLAEIRNLGQRPVTLEATAIAPGVGRQRAVIAQLAPGSTARRELLLRGVYSADAGRILLAVEDVDVGARLNYQVDAP
ncbi:MAG: hypothetical protein NCW75_05040 [Phycisphaera sp.]|nr:MAG: hypothetical protein NCW75_05040 [Phycisphaera sp.]